MNDFLKTLPEDLQGHKALEGYESPEALAQSVVNFSNMTLQDGLPEDLQKEKSLGDFKDVAGLAKSFVDTKKMLGNSVKIPDENSSPEDRQAFYSKLGVPGKTEEYTAKMPMTKDGKEFPDLDTEVIDYFKAGAHELNYTDEQLQFALNVNATLAQQMMDSMDTEAKETENALIQEWGNDFEENLKRADMMLGEYGDNDLKQAIMNAGLSNNLKFNQFLHKMAKATMDDKHLSGETVEVANIEEEIDKLMQSKEYGDNNPRVHAKVHALIEKKQKMKGK